MKHVMVVMLVLLIAVSCAGVANAESEVEVKGKTTVTPEGSQTQMKADTPSQKVEIQTKADAEGDIKEADMERKYKGGEKVGKSYVNTEKVTFHSFNDKDDTITVIKSDQKVVTYPTKFDHAKRDYVIKNVKKGDTITATYNTKLGQPVVEDFIHHTK